MINMLKASLWAVSFSLFALNVSAQTCENEPTCESLGYIYNEKNCPKNSKISLRCPLDLSAYWCKDPIIPTCATGGYVDACPSGQTGTQVAYSGLTCYKNCKNITCATGGYVDTCPSGQIGTQISYNSLSCYTNCIKLEVGAIVYSDKTVSKEVISGKTPIAIVFDVQKKLAVALEGKVLAWGGYGTDIPTLTNCSEDNVSSCDTDGKENTAKIIAYGQANNIEYPAAEYCHNYSTEGTNAGDWYFPSIAEFNLIRANKNDIDPVMSKVGTHSLGTGYYWSSNEVNSNNSWEYVVTSGNIGIINKNKYYFTRAVLAL